MFLLSLAAYGVLGVVWASIGLTPKMGEYWASLFLVILIDIIRYKQGRDV